MPNGLETVSIAYNGHEMTKLEVMTYLDKLITAYEKATRGFEKTRDEINARREKLYIDLKRRTYYEPVVEKPTGLAALSGKKRRAYDRWLLEAPKRAKEKADFEAAEDRRIAPISKELDEVEQQLDQCYDQAKADAQEFADLCAQHIIAPAYRKDDIPKILFLYLYNGRAHTLQDAINLYHQELHNQKMEDIAREQAAQARADHYAEMQAIQAAAREHAEALDAIHSEAAAARRSIENIEFTADMMFWLNL